MVIQDYGVNDAVSFSTKRYGIFVHTWALVEILFPRGSNASSRNLATRRSLAGRILGGDVKPQRPASRDGDPRLLPHPHHGVRVGVRLQLRGAAHPTPPQPLTGGGGASRTPWTFSHPVSHPLSHPVSCPLAGCEVATAWSSPSCGQFGAASDTVAPLDPRDSAVAPLDESPWRFRARVRNKIQQQITN